jgi:hypothetical protein
VPLNGLTNLQCRLIQACTSADAIGHRLASLILTPETAPLTALICACKVTVFGDVPSRRNSCQAVSESDGGGANARSGFTPYAEETAKKNNEGTHSQWFARSTETCLPISPDFFNQIFAGAQLFNRASASSTARRCRIHYDGLRSSENLSKTCKSQVTKRRDEKTILGPI